jgi:tetratricopeptide (TPR) repeat protein
MITAAALLAWGAGCGGGTATGPKAKSGMSEADKAQVSTAAANKFNTGLEALAQHDKAGDWSDATCTQVAQMFNDAAKEQGDKQFNEALYNAGLAYQRCKKSTEAKALFKQILDSDSKFHRAKVQLAMYAFADSGEKDLDGAINTIREAAVVDAQFKNVEALVDLGMLYIKRNNKVEDQDGKSDLARAKRFIQSALALDDGYMPAFNQMALLYLETAKQAAGHDTKRKMAIHGKQKRVDTQALDLAALVCSQAIKKNGKYASIHNTAGMIQVELGNLNGAVSEFNSARTLDPSFFEAQMNYAAVNLQFRGFEQAEGAYRKAIEIRPNDYDAHLGLALALRGNINDTNFDKNVAEASAELTKAKTLAPDRAETYYNEAILTQEYKAKSGGAGGKSSEQELQAAKKLFSDFISKATGSEFADAVKRSKDRMTEIDQIIAFNAQSEKDRKAAEADAKQKAAEAEAKGEEPGAPGAPGAPAPEGEKKEEKKAEPSAP